ncbi:MAG TPA: serine hydrolase domain-containing protein, partial [Pyrinomonadaceae bacterium]|nr:serine hydrolase domain-containing protein [Pyrinomonadaceae bacterium]
MGVSKLQSSLCSLFVICVSVVFFPCFGQQISRKIDHFVKQEMAAHQIPGVSLAVLRRGKIILLKSYGLANVEHHVPVKPSTIFQSGSIGKQFTAAAVMILVQENKLALDDKIS